MSALPELNFKNYTLNSKEFSLQGRIFNGAIRFSVFPRQRVPGNNKPVLSINFDASNQAYVMLMSNIDQVRKSTTALKLPLVRNQFNPQTKTRSLEWVFTVEKDAELCYKITITDARTNVSHSFNVTASSNFSNGTDAAPDKMKQSTIGLEMFIQWLKLAFEYAPLTADKGVPGQRGGGGAPRPAPAAAPVDDMPF